MQEVPTREYPDEAMAAHLIGYVGEANEDQMESDGVTHRIDRRPVRRRARLQQAADGRRRRQARGGQQRGPRNPHARGDCARAGPPRAAHHQLRDAEGGGRRVPRLRLLGIGGGARAQDRRSADADQPAGVRSQRFCHRHRSRDVGTAQHRQAAPAAESRDPGTLSTGIDLQDRGGDRRARRRPHHARAPDLLPGRRHLLRALLQVPPGRRPWQRRSAPRDREVLQHLLLHGRQHARRRQDVQVVGKARPRAQERHRSAQRSREHRARRRSGSRSDTTSAGIRAKRSRWRLARASWR